ncbi:glycosyltransferase [Fervidobacterium thailandense]
MEKRKKRMLQMITRSDWAGGQKVLYSLVYGLLKYYPDEFEIEVACGKENGMLIPELEKLGIKVYVIPDLVREISPLRDLKAFIRIFKLIKRGKYDIVHLHSSKAGFLGRIAARLAGVPKIVYTIHGWWPIEQYNGWKKKILIFVERIGAKFCDKLVFLCHNDMKKAENWRIGKKEQYVIIPNAIIPIDNSKFQSGKLRKELGISDNIKIVGNVARLDPPKNPIRFLEIARQVLMKRQDVRFVWIGGSVVEDFYGEQVERWLSEHSEMREVVYFLPFRKDSIELMADFDVLLITSDMEGLPLVALEAKNLGIPVVSTNVGCLVEQSYVRTFMNQEQIVSHLVELLNGNSRKPSSYEELGIEFRNSFVKGYVQIYLNSH